MLERLEADKTLVATLAGRISPNRILQAVSDRVLDIAHQAEWAEDDPSRRAALEAKRPELEPAERLRILQSSVFSNRQLILALDDFDANLTGHSVSNPQLLEFLSSWLADPGRTHILLVTRGEFDTQALGAPVGIHVLGPLSEDELKRLVVHLPHLKDLSDTESDQLVAAAAGDPLTIELLDSCFAVGVSEAALDLLSADVAPSDQPDFPVLNRRQQLLELLVSGINKLPLAQELLLGTCVYRKSVDTDGLRWQISASRHAEGEPSLSDRLQIEFPDGVDLDRVEDLRPDERSRLEKIITEARRPPIDTPHGFLEALQILEETAVLSLDHDDAGGTPRYRIHPWVSQALREKYGPLTTSHAKAASYWEWRVSVVPQSRKEDVADLYEARYHHALSQNVEAATHISAVILNQLTTWGEWAQSEDLIAETLEWIEAGSFDEGWWQRAYGDVRQARGDYSGAQSWYERSLRNFQAANAPGELARLYHQLGNAAQARGHYSEAEAYYRSALDIKLERESDRDTGVTFHALATLAQNQGRLDEAEGLYVEARRLFENASDTRGVAASIHQLGNIAQQSGKFDEAEAQYQLALEIATRLGDRRAMTSALSSLGIVLDRMGRHGEATEIYRQVVSALEEMGDRPGLASAYHNLGLSIFQMEDYSAAEEWFQRSLEVERELGDVAGMAATFHQLGMVSQVRGRIALAEAYYEQSLRWSQEVGLRPEIGSTLSQLGFLYWSQGDQTKALEFQLRALATRLEMASSEAWRNVAWLHDRLDEQGEEAFRARLAKYLDLDSIENLLSAIESLPRESAAG